MANKRKEQKVASDNWYKNEENDKVWWLDNSDTIGEFIFSFDRKKTFNLYTDYPLKLSKEEKEIFDKENPFWENYFADRQVK